MADWSVAVIGLACRVPGASSPEQLWQVLAEGRDEIRPVPPERTALRAELATATAATAASATAATAASATAATAASATAATAAAGSGGWGGFIEDLDRFEPELFCLSDTEAASMDPQQRLALELAWSAAEQAGRPLPGLAGSRTGVYLGQSAQDMAMLTAGAAASPFSNTGMCHAIAANRVSYCFDLRGPSLSVDTACSSSLVAVHLAARGLAAGDCDLALAGGVNVLLAGRPQRGAELLTALAPDGRCRSFDAAASGYVRSEGGAMVMLKRLADALADDDPVLAVLAGSAVGQDGRTNGLTAPSARGQADVIAAALRAAGVPGSAIDYVQAHGTGTPLGDPIEVRALLAALGERARPVALSSVKANIGHLEAAAGIVGLVATVLMLEHRQLPPAALLRELNPRIDASRVLVPRSLGEWPARPDGPGTTHHPATACVSSFGFGGTNAAVILCSARADPSVPVQAPAPATAAAPSGPVLLPLSARSADGLRELTAAYLPLVLGTGDWADLAGLAAASLLRPHGQYRRAVVAAGRAELISGLESAAGSAGALPVPQSDRVAFVFSGHSTDAALSGARLSRADPVFADAVAEYAAELRDVLGWDAAEVLLGERQADVSDPAVAQPLAVVTQLALTAALRAAGVAPDLVAGHSSGEIPAAVVAGKIDRAAAWRVLAARIAVTAAVPGGMLAVAGALEQVASLLGADVEIAAVNGPRSVVLSGTHDGLADAARRLAAAGVITRRLPVTYPSHSAAMAGPAARLAARLDWLRPRQARLGFFSTVLAADATGEPLDAGYWASNLRQPVRLAETVLALRSAGVSHFVEIGPHPALAGAIAQCVPGATVLASLHRDGQYNLGSAGIAARFFEAGVRLSPAAGQAARRYCRWLPPTPFARRPVPTPGIDRTGIRPAAAVAAPAPVTMPGQAAAGLLRQQLATCQGRDEALQRATDGVRRLLMALVPGRWQPDVALADLGLDSVRAVALRAELEREMHEPIPITLLWACPTPAAVAAALTDMVWPASAVTGPLPHGEHAAASRGAELADLLALLNEPGAT